MKQVIRFTNRHQIIAIFCVLTVLVGLSWIASGVNSQNAVAEQTENSVQIADAGAQGSDSLKRFGALKVSAVDNQSKAAGSPRVALAADFDADGVNDLLVAHNDRLVLHRGNINAFAPQTEEAWEAIRDGRFVSPFERKTRSTGVPAAADFILSGDFNRDSRLDAAFAARGDNILYVLEGDGKGNFPNLRRIETAGAITSLAAGDVNRADGLTDLIVGTRSAEGFGLQIFSGLGDIFAAGSLVYNLPSQAEAIAVGQLNENEFADIAIAVGNDIIIMSGADTTEKGVLPPAEIQRLPQSANVKSLVVGDFLPDRANRTELAALSSDGTIRIFARGSLDTRPISINEHLAEQVREYQAKGYPIPERILSRLTKEDLREPLSRRESDVTTWAEAETVTAAVPNLQLSAQSVLTTGRISGGAADDLIVLDQSSSKVLVMPFQLDYTKIDRQNTRLSFEGKRAIQDFDADGLPVAALALNLNYDSELDLLVLKEGSVSPSAFVSAPQAAFTVNSNLDKVDANLGDGICQTNVAGQCTLRAAIMQANKTPGNDSITIQSGIGTITINLGSPDDDAFGQNDETTGDLDITCVIDAGTFACQQPYTSNDNDLTITGAAGGSIVQAGTFTGSITTDRVFDIGQDGIFGGGFGGSNGIIVSMSNLTIQNGNVREQTVNGVNGANVAFGGGIRYDGFGVMSTHGSLTLTNTTLNNNQSDNAGGGVYHVFGSHTSSGSTYTGNITKAGEGGGLFFGAGTSNSNVSVVNSTFTSNEARQGTVFGTFTANADGGGLRINADPNTVTVTNTNFTSNIAQQDGGAIKTLGGAVTVTGGTITGNTARRHGGGAFGDQDTAGTGRSFTFSGSTLRNNTANSDNLIFAGDGAAGDGGAIFRDRGVLNITNTTIGGTGAGEPNTATNGGGVAHAFTVDSAAGNTSNQTTININGGSINGNIANTDGGGVYHNAQFFDITASTLNIGQTTAIALTGNKAKNNGGGIHVSNAATASLNNMTLRSNQANSDTSGGGDGGGLFQNTGTTTFTGTLTVGGTSFANSAVNGGGIRNNAGTVTIPANAIINLNTATGTGGGISNVGTLSALATPTISNNTATGNGGGIFNSGTLGAITTPTLNSNSAATGGGIFSSNGALSITNGSVSSNTATTGKGGGIEHSGASNSTVTGVVITNNTGSGIHITGTGSLDAANNIITGNSGDGITKIGTGVGSHFNSNTIHTNGELGIDLLDNAVTPNDANDTDTGPNNLQNFPVLNYVRRGDGVANVTLNVPNGKYRIQYYANTTCDPSGFGEGESLKATQVVDITSVATQTFFSPVIAFGTMEQITATATHDANGNSNFDDDGSTSEFSACRKVNTLPTIAATAGNTRQQGSPAVNSQIATVADPDQTLNTLVVTVNGGASATVNGVTVSNIAVSAAGVVTADIVASCSAMSPASFTLRVTDNATEFNEATLSVAVTANTAPTAGNYPNTTVNAGSNVTVTPDAAPTDNVSISSVTATAAPAGFTGTFSGNTTTGAVTINNAAPFGVYTITVTTTDNCGLATNKTFTLTVNAIPTITAQAGVTRQQGSPATNSQIATVNDADQTEDTLVVTIRAVGGVAPGMGTATVNGVTVSNIAVSAAGVVTADVVADCTATNASFTLRVTDSNGAFNEATLNVAVTPNTAPTVGTYPNTNLNPGGGTTVTPTAAPADNGSIASATAAAPGFTGTFTVNTTTGVVTIANANPPGTYTVTVTFTDNCGATTSPTFTLTVASPPTIAKSFTPALIGVNGISTLTVTITNPAANTVALTGVGVTDTFPAGLEVDAVPTATNTCGGTFAPVAGATSITLSGGSIPINSSCSISVKVKGTTAGAKVNTTGNVTSTNGGTGGTATATLTVSNSYEADVFTRPSGDGSILSDDVVQVRRFQNTTDTADQTTDEFQRADSSPFASRGDGKILSDDVVQARRYQNGTDPKQPAAGPMTQAPPRPADMVDQLFSGLSKTVYENALIGNPREVRVENATASPGQMVTVNIRVNAVGNESEYGFIISYDSSVLSNPVIGAGTAGASVRSCNIATAGTINCSVGGFPNNNPTSSDPGIGEIAAGNNQLLITVTFTVAANATPGATSLTLSNVNASSDMPQLFTPTATNGTVTILAPTAAGVSVSGRVVRADGRGVANARVEMTDQSGNVRSARTNPLGYYRFEAVAAGENYVISIRHKQYEFSPQVLTIIADREEVNFVASP